MKTSIGSQLLRPFLSLDREFVVLDTETTDIIKDGELPDIVSVGLVKVSSSRRVSSPIEFKTRPTKLMHPLAEKVHGISDREAATYPSFVSQWADIAEHLTGKIVVIHNAEFDWPILLDHISKYNLENPAVDSVFCSQKNAAAWAKVAGVSGSSRGPALDKLTKYFGVEDRRRAMGGIHGAGNDAWQTAMVVESLRDLAQQQ